MLSDSRMCSLVVLIPSPSNDLNHSFIIGSLSWVALSRCRVTIRLGTRPDWHSDRIADVVFSVAADVRSGDPADLSPFNSPGPSMEMPTDTLYRLKTSICRAAISVALV